jgi:hypothetical protein
MQIKGWLARFEAAREKDRPRKPMDWIRLPCDLQSTGYGHLMQDAKGAQHLGVFIALVEIVAALPIAVRDGTLLSPQGEPLSLRAISIKARIPETIIEESIAALQGCGWLVDEPAEISGGSRKFLENPGGDEDGDGDGEGDEIHTGAPDGARVSDPSLPSPRPRTVPARKGTAQQQEWFEQFWAAYWRKVARVPAQAAFDRLVQDQATFEAVMKGVNEQRDSMMSRNEQHRPHASTWLEAQRWTDEPPRDSIRDIIDRA